MLADHSCITTQYLLASQEIPAWRMDKKE